MYCKTPNNIKQYSCNKELNTACAFSYNYELCQFMFVQSLSAVNNLKLHES